MFFFSSVHLTYGLLVTHLKGSFLDYACVNEIVHDNHPYNLSLIRNIKVSGQNDGVLKN